MPTKKVEHAEAFICPVCHEEQAAKSEAHHVVNDAGDGYCCSEECAGMLEAHHRLPHDKRQKQILP